jgi:hypothetical protein
MSPHPWHPTKQPQPVPRTYVRKPAQKLPCRGSRVVPKLHSYPVSSLVRRTPEPSSGRSTVQIGHVCRSRPAHPVTIRVRDMQGAWLMGLEMRAGGRWPGCRACWATLRWSLLLIYSAGTPGSSELLMLLVHVLMCCAVHLSLLNVETVVPCQILNVSILLNYFPFFPYRYSLGRFAMIIHR